MIDLRTAAQQALEALEIGWSTTHTGKDARELGMKAITALKAALAQEHDAELSAALGWPGGISDPVLDRKTLLRKVAELNTPLTDEQIDRITDQQWASNNHKPIYAAHRAYARAIERARGIGGQDEH